MKRILYLATADARGHLMRCQLLVHALRERGVVVTVVTTSREGRAFLAQFGIAAALLSSHYKVEFDEQQNMQRLRTEWRVFRYFTSPRRFWRDLRWLSEQAAGADLVINDSFHPALLVAPIFDLAMPPIVHVYGETLRRAFEDNFLHRVPGPVARFFRARMAAFTDAAFARIVHSLTAAPGGEEIAPRTFRLPPVVALPTRRKGASGLAVVYLNPHFRDPAIALAIERAVSSAGLTLHAVAEGYASRSGWRAYDPALAEALAGARVFISAPGLGALAQARATGVPFVAIATDQPEQRANAAFADAVIDVAALGDALPAVLRQLPPRKRATNDGALETWITLIERLAGEERRAWAA